VKKIGKAARALDLHPDTLVRYERKGLIPAAPRDITGARRYSDEDIERLRALILPKNTGR
jgi:DNA-binding transcriptional MerR regulator